MSPSKAKAQRKHAKRRARERYGLDLTSHDFQMIINAIRKRKSIPIKRQSCRISHHMVLYKRRWLRVVYDKNRRQIVTFLPNEFYGWKESA